MINRLLFSAICLGLVAGVSADTLRGFEYARETAPSGKEWESPERLSLNKEQPHAWFFSFADVEAARRVLPENSCYWMSLNGTWKFHWAGNPEERPEKFYECGYDVSGWDNIAVPGSWNIQGLQKDGTQRYGTPVYVNQPVIFYHERKVDDWRQGVMRTPPSNWTTYKNRNEVGSYRRTFSVPAAWNDREIYIDFDGVDSFFYLWINGQYVGFSKNSRNLAQFNITQYLKTGENSVSVEVYRSSDGSFLEAQDMFRLPGIFRTVALEAKPKVQVRDMLVTPRVQPDGESGTLAIKAMLRNALLKDVRNWRIDYTLYANALYSDENTKVDAACSAPVNCLAGNGGEMSVEAELVLKQPKLWSAEAPYRYVVVGQLKDSKGNVVETFSTYTGFRNVEIKDTKAEDDEFGLAGRYFYVNGKPVKLKGVNRHESEPSVGHAVTRAMMEKDLFLMKRANINHVRDSHYPDDPYWYYLCNRYGIYLMDEANVESHEYYYGPESLSHPKEWEAAHVARNMEMVHQNYNHPSIVIWSMGNEAGPGDNFKAAYKAMRDFDKLRPIQYERNNDISDIGCRQYPDIPWVRKVATGKADVKYPYHINEYAHSMGNAVGDLERYWDAMESTNYFIGGAIWDWVDQSMYYWTKDGTRYLAYGGDFGDTPNDGQFVMNGLIFGDRQPKPQYYEVKKVYQYVATKWADNGQIEMFGKNYFEPAAYDVEYVLLKDGLPLKKAEDKVLLSPRGKSRVEMPFRNEQLDAGAEYFVNVSYKLAIDMPWAAKGYVIADDQLLLQAAGQRTALSEDMMQGKQLQLDGKRVKKARKNTVFKKANDSASRTKCGIHSGISEAQPVMGEANDKVTVSGEGFEVVFDMLTGTIHSLDYAGQTVIPAGCGPRLDAIRALTNNDGWCYKAWYENGLNQLRHTVLQSEIVKQSDGSVQLKFTVNSQAAHKWIIEGGTASGRNSLTETEEDALFRFLSNVVWTVFPDGSIDFASAVNSNNHSLALGRLGYTLQVNPVLDRVKYYGRGPVENYRDRKACAFVGLYENTVAGMMTNYTKPQENGNHEAVRWLSMTAGDDSDKGVLFVATTNSIASQPQMSIGVQAYDDNDLLLAGHPYQLPESDATFVHLDAGVTGLGGNSCGPSTMPEDRIMAVPTTFGFMIRRADAVGGAKIASPNIGMPQTIMNF